MKIYTESPAKILIPARQKVKQLPLPNQLMKYVSENHLSSQFRNEDILINTTTKKEKISLLEKLKEIGAKFTIQK